MAGKGDKPRPINKERFDKNFYEIFGKFVPLWKRKKQKKRKKGVDSK